MTTRTNKIFKIVLILSVALMTSVTASAQGGGEGAKLKRAIGGLLKGMFCPPVNKERQRKVASDKFKARRLERKTITANAFQREKQGFIGRRVEDKQRLAEGSKALLKKLKSTSSHWN